MTAGAVLWAVVRVAVLGPLLLAGLCWLLRELDRDITRGTRRRR